MEPVPPLSASEQSSAASRVARAAARSCRASASRRGGSRGSFLGAARTPEANHVDVGRALGKGSHRQRDPHFSAEVVFVDGAARRQPVQQRALVRDRGHVCTKLTVSLISASLPPSGPTAGRRPPPGGTFASRAARPSVCRAQGRPALPGANPAAGGAAAGRQGIPQAPREPSRAAPGGTSGGREGKGIGLSLSAAYGRDFGRSRRKRHRAELKRRLPATNKS
jgi:hypothetical protein